MKAYFTRDALLQRGWSRDVRIVVDELGDIAEVRDGASAEGAERLAGPVLPGMANLHSHAFQRAMAGLTEVRGSFHDDFWSWRELMYRFVARLTPEHLQAIATHLYIEMLKRGYTAVAEFHYVHNELGGKPCAERAELLLRHLAAARDTGIAITLLPSLYAWSNFGRRPLQPRQKRFASDVEAVLAMVEAARRAAGRDPDAAVGAAPHSLRAVDPEALRALVDGLHAMEPDAPIHIHAAEQTKEVEDCIAWGRRRPVEWLLEHMPVDARWCIVHATHATPEEIAGLAASGAVAGLCPSTECNLGDGIFALTEYREAGGRYGVGGDSHVSRDPAEELRLLEYVQRLRHRRRNVVVTATRSAVGTTLWIEAAAGGAQALGRRMGAIVPGRRADLVVLDGEAADLAGRSGDAIANLLMFSGTTDLVRDVMVGGRWVANERRHPMEAAAAAAFKQATRELLA